MGWVWPERGIVHSIDQGPPGPTCLHEHLPYVPDLSSPPATASGPA